MTYICTSATNALHTSFKTIIPLLIFICNILTANGQNYEKQWNKIDKLIEEQKYTSAYENATSLLAKARKNNLSRETLISAWYVAKSAAAYKEDQQDSIASLYEELLPTLDSIDQLICHSQLAQLYFSYSSNFDLNEATRKELLATHRHAALANPDLLLATPIEPYRRLCKNDRHYTSHNSQKSIIITPTMYDVLVRAEIDMEEDEHLHYQWLQELRQRHSADSDSLLILLDKEIIEYREEIPNEPKPTTDDWQALINQYRNCNNELLAVLYLGKAKLLSQTDKFAAIEQCKEICSLFPKSKAKSEALSIIATIRERYINLEVGTQLEERYGLAVISTRNIDSIYYRIVPWDSDNNDLYSTNITAIKPIHQWQQVFHNPNDYEYHENYVYLPPLPAGSYLLIASPSADPKKYFYEAQRFECTDIAIVEADGDWTKGYIIDRKSGKPMADKKIVIKSDDRSSSNKAITTTTDANGYFTIIPTEAKRSYSHRLIVEHNGYKYTKRTYNRTFQNEIEWKPQLSIMTDRPVYKPGEQVQFVCVSYISNMWDDANTVAGDKLTIQLFDINNEKIDTLHLITNAQGQVSGTFRLPADCLPGHYRIQISSTSRQESKQIKVEAYKQPKYSVQLQCETQEVRLDHETILSGDALSYSSIPINDAKVTYTIRRVTTNFWRWWWNRPTGEVVENGETQCNANGHFEIRFIPKPDMSEELDDNTIFAYTLQATVTDINGETHEQTLTVMAGYRSAFIKIETDTCLKKFDKITFRYVNLNNKSIDGTIHLKIERLKQPRQALLPIPVKGDLITHHTMPQSEWEKKYPHIAYSDSIYNSKYWQVARIAHEADIPCSAELTAQTHTLPPLGDGIYRLTLSSTTSTGAVVKEERIINITSNKAQRPNGNQLLWHSLSHTTIEEGETLTLRIGSRHSGVHVILSIADGNGNVTRQQHTINNEIKDISIPITHEMLGGLSIAMLAAQDGAEYHQTVKIAVPYTHKRLIPQLTTFRDKLSPGDREQWTISIADNDGKGVTATAIATMYDAALDEYGSLDWHLWPWRGNNSHTSLSLSMPREYASRNTHKHPEYLSFDYATSTWQLSPFDLFSHRYILYRSAKANGVMMFKSCAMSEEAAETEEAALPNVVSQNAMISLDMAENGDTDMGDATPQNGKNEEPLNIRTNLSTLSFFEPCLLSNKEGNITISFTAPELLTKWNINLLSYTPTLQTGTLHQSVVTQKELMVEPMAPRFFRQGDEVYFATKVSNLTDSTLSAVVRLNIINAETSQDWADYKEQTLQVAPHSSNAVSFVVSVPTDCHAAIYRITAQSAHHSDGQQDILPVVSNRQLVTESQAMYINEAGTKTYTLPSLQSSPTREMRMLSVEFCSNPIWLAVQALPYVKEQENPSNLYLMNQYYCNAIGSRIVSLHPEIETVFQRWKSDTVNPMQSRLNANSDLKLTDMSETPWLQTAQSEEQRQQQIANFFDRKQMAKQQRIAGAQLSQAQRPDGGWSWMPDGEYSSVYITRDILFLLGDLTDNERRDFSSNIERAMQYVEKEVAKDYAYYKKNKIKDAIDLGYLLLRSIYPKLPMSDAAEEAYKYYMDNAERLCLSQKGLLNKAQMALIMHRAGKRVLARKLIEQLRQCSLTTDEMGMYWRDNVSGLFYYDRPIEVQSTIIQAFSEVVSSDRKSVARMRQWLLKQKQTTAWQSDRASVAAIRALLPDDKPIEIGVPATITIGDSLLASPAQAATGYQSKRWQKEQIKPEMQTVTINQHNESIGWGAAYWQYLDDIDKIASSTMGISLHKVYLRVNNDGTTTEIKEDETINIGDRMRIQILVNSDRNIEYIEMKDARPAGFEPVNTSSGWRWNDGLSYYAAVTNSALHCYIDRLGKGSYVISYDLFATQAGTFSSGLCLIQSLYAPEFRAIGGGRKLTVKGE